MQGIISAVPTAFDNKGIPKKAAYLEHCQWLLDTGCDGLNILGSTGEANSISKAGRKETMTWEEDGLDKSKLMVGTRTPSLNETIDLIHYAGELDYPVALVLPSYYYNPVSDAGLLARYNAIDEVIADRTILIYFYNYPHMTGINIPIEVIAELFRQHPKRFTGIKDSSGNLDYCREVVAACLEMIVFPSSETSIDQAHASRFAGCLSATVNFTVSLCAEAWKTRASPSANLMTTISQQHDAIAAAGLIPAIKYLVSNRTEDADWRKVMPPFVSLDIAAGKTLAASLLN